MEGPGLVDLFSRFEATLGTIQILRKQNIGIGGGGQMLTFAYIVDEWV